MIEYLEKLVGDSQYRKALDYAEELLVRPEATPTELVAVNCALTIGRFKLDEFHGASVSGRVTLKLALEFEEWDYFGTGCLYLGLALDRLGRSEEAIEIWYQYLSRLSLYGSARKYESTVWFNLGVVSARSGRTAEALDLFQKALVAANRLGNERLAHGVRHALVYTYLQSGDLAKVPRLLAKCLHYLRHHPDAPDVHVSRLWHLRHRAEYALRTQRYRRALNIGQRGLREASGNAEYLYFFYITLTRMARLSGSLKDALGYLLSARVCAIKCRRYDLEQEAATMMYDITTSTPDLVHDMVPVDTASVFDTTSFFHVRMKE